MTTALAVAKKVPAFEDLHVFEGPHGYITSNEEPLIWKELFKDLSLERAAGICSAGEVGFFSLLPSVEKELVLVDHSNKSIAVAMIKWLLIQEKGWEETHKLLTARDYTELGKVITSFVKYLPESVQKGWADLQLKYEKGREWAASGGEGTFYEVVYTRGHKYALPSPALPAPKLPAPLKPASTRTSHQLVNLWRGLPTTCSEVESKLSKVRFIHGDMSDLVAQGPFDLFYISNALDHGGRNLSAKGSAIKAITKVVKPGGFVASAESGYSGNRIQEWEVVQKTRGTRGMSWNHVLYRTPS